VDVGIASSIGQALQCSQGAVLEKALAVLQNLCQSEPVRVHLCSNDIFQALVPRMMGCSEPKMLAHLLQPVVCLLKSPNPVVHDAFLRSGGVFYLMRLLNKLCGNVSGSLKSADYELLRTILVIFFFLSAGEMPSARLEIARWGFVAIACNISSLILPADVGTQSVLLQLVTNLSLDEANEIPLLESGFLLVTVDYLGSLSDELVSRSCMLLANMSLNPRVRASIRQFGWDAFIPFLLKHHFTEIQRHTLRFIVNISANPTCRKLLLDAGTVTALELLKEKVASVPALTSLIAMALDNLKVPIDKEVADSFKVETVEVEVDHAGDAVPAHSQPSNVAHAGVADQNVSSSLLASISTPISESTSASTLVVPPSSSSSNPSSSSYSSSVYVPSNSGASSESISFTSVAVQDPFQQLDLALQNYFGPDSGLSSGKLPSNSTLSSSSSSSSSSSAKAVSSVDIVASVPLISVRPRTATMTKDPKDEPLYIRREKIAREVFDTEEKYVSNLKVLLDVFVHPLNQAISDHKPILTSEEMNTVFSVVQLIYNLHVSFLSKLRPIFDEWTWSSCIGSFFETLADRLKVYETFVNNYDRALALLDSPALQKRKAFQQFMKDAAGKAVGVGYAGISHYLIMPIQRPPRFLMLLGELVKYTPAQHLDMPSLKRSVQKMSALTSYLNEARRLSESHAKVEEMAAKFGGPPTYEGELFDVGKTGRVFIKEGSLVEERSHLPKSSARDTLLLTKRDSWHLPPGTGGIPTTGISPGNAAPSSSSSSSHNLLNPSNPSLSPSPSSSSSSASIADSILMQGGSLSSTSLGLAATNLSSSTTGKVKRTPRYVILFLFNDALLVASMQKKILRLVNVLPLSQVSLVDPNYDTTSKQGPLKFALKMKDDGYPLVFLADNELEKGEWIQSLNTALKASLARQDQDSQISELDKLIDQL